MTQRISWQLLTALGLSLATQLGAGQLLFQVDTNRSTLNVALTVQGVSDTNTSPLTGMIVGVLDDDFFPQRLALHDYDLSATTNYQFLLSYGLFGQITANVVGLRVFHPSPGASARRARHQRQLHHHEPALPHRRNRQLPRHGLCLHIASAPALRRHQRPLHVRGGNHRHPGRHPSISNQTALLSFQFSFTTFLDPTNTSLGSISGTAVVFATAPLGLSLLVPSKSVWKYLDNGADPGPAWVLPGFEDGGWPSGPAELGYGDAADGRPEATVIGYGPSDTNKFVTTYFRHAWNVPDTRGITNLLLRLLRDDGAVVYLNGTEVFRNNLPPGTLTPDTLALLAIAGADEATFLEVNLSPAGLLAGRNLLAVAVHQSSLGSSDLSFDLELRALRQPPGPQLELEWTASQHQLRWPSRAQDLVLWLAPQLTPPLRWERVLTPPSDDGTYKTVVLPNTPGARFYQLLPP